MLCFEASKTRGPNSIQNKGLPSSCRKPGLFITRYLANAIIDWGEIDPNENFQGCRFCPLDIPKQFCHRMGTFRWTPKYRVKPGALSAAEKFRAKSTTQKFHKFQCHSDKLGGGNSNISYFHPYLGKWSKFTSIFFKWVVQPPTSHRMSQWQKLQALNGWTAAWPETFWKKTANWLDGRAPHGVMEVSNFDWYGKWWKYGIMC